MDLLIGLKEVLANLKSVCCSEFLIESLFNNSLE